MKHGGSIDFERGSSFPHLDNKTSLCYHIWPEGHDTPELELILRENTFVQSCKKLYQLPGPKMAKYFNFYLLLF